MKRRKAKRPPLKYERIDPRCRTDILRCARGEPSAWPADNYSTHGTYQQRFDRGDQQMGLWAIVLAAIGGEQPPKWATDELEKAMIVMSAGADWTDVFGRERAERGNNTGANRDSEGARRICIACGITLSSGRRRENLGNCAMPLQMNSALAAQLLSAITGAWSVSTNRNPHPKTGAF
jgi:hypothetical protein